MRGQVWAAAVLMVMGLGAAAQTAAPSGLGASTTASGKRPMTFDDMMKMRRDRKSTL